MSKHKRQGLQDSLIPSKQPTTKYTKGQANIEHVLEYAPQEKNENTEGCSRLKMAGYMRRLEVSGLNIRTNASPNIGQDQVSEGV